MATSNEWLMCETPNEGLRIMAFLMGSAIALCPVKAQAQNVSFLNLAPAYVFFDWGKGDLTRDAESGLDAVAAAFRSAPGRKLRLIGHSDRSGSDAANDRSARQRAETVAVALQSRGVPRAAIAVASRGEDRPLIATADGVREVQNRRVEIFVVGDD